MDSRKKPVTGPPGPPAVVVRLGPNTFAVVVSRGDEAGEPIYGITQEDIRGWMSVGMRTAGQSGSRQRGDRFPPLELDLEAVTCSRSRFRFRCVR